MVESGLYGFVEGVAHTHKYLNNGVRYEQYAFLKSIKNSRGVLPLLKRHDLNSMGGVTTLLEERPEGLFFEGVIFLGIPECRKMYQEIEEAAKNGRPLGVSIGCISHRDGERRYNYEVVEQGHASLIELSVTPTPADTDTWIRTVGTHKSRPDMTEKLCNMLVDYQRLMVGAYDVEVWIPPGTSGSAFGQSIKVRDERI